MRALPVRAVHPNRPREFDYVMNQAIEVNRLYLRGGVADLVAQISDEKAEALIERAFFEQSLPPQWIAHKRRSH
jgi:hypothetical protein